jgi:predicted protein tyrosine phosphatase
MDSPVINIEVVGREEANVILASAEERSKVSFLISIGAPEDDLPIGFSNVPDRLRLLFGDTETAEHGASEADIKCLIDLAKELNGSSGTVLIHCEAGVSRSPAAALILYTCLMGQGSERKAMDLVLRQRPFASPNRRMVALADRLLGRGGRLMRVLD